MKEPFFLKQQDIHEEKGAPSTRREIRKQIGEHGKEKVANPFMVRRETHQGAERFVCLNHPYCGKNSRDPTKGEAYLALYQRTNGREVLLGRAHSKECAEEAVKKFKREKRFVSP